MPSATSALWLAVTLLCLSASRAAGATGSGIELLTGLSHHLGSTLDIEQQGQTTLSIDASFRSRSFSNPILWAMRLWRGDGRRAWCLELVHDKLYLVDPPSEVQSFAISHGLNLLTVQREWRGLRSGLALDGRVGAGFVLAHAENEVRGRRLDETGGLAGRGFYATGPVVVAGATRRFSAAGRFALAVETRAAAARVHVPVVDGEARMTAYSIHLLVGIGFRTPPPGPAAPPR